MSSPCSRTASTCHETIGAHLLLNFIPIVACISLFFFYIEYFIVWIHSIYFSINRHSHCAHFHGHMFSFLLSEWNWFEIGWLCVYLFKKLLSFKKLRNSPQGGRATLHSHQQMCESASRSTSKIRSMSRMLAILTQGSGISLCFCVSLLTGDTKSLHMGCRPCVCLPCEVSQGLFCFCFLLNFRNSFFWI